MVGTAVTIAGTNFGATQGTGTVTFMFTDIEGSTVRWDAHPQAMQEAAMAYSRGEWAEAERWCRQILAARGDYFDALNLLGIIAARTQRLDEAAHLLARAANENPGEATAHNNYGNVLKDLKRFSAALERLSADRGAIVLRDWPGELRDDGRFWDYEHMLGTSADAFTDALNDALVAKAPAADFFSRRRE